MLRLFISILLVIPLLVSEGYTKSPPPGTGADDVPANILLMLDTSGSMSSTLPSGNTKYPMDVTYDTQGNIYIAEYYDVVKKYNSLGEFQFLWGGYDPGGADGKFDYTYAIDSDSLNNIYVSDQNYGRVQKFTPDGTFVTKMILASSPARGVAVDNNDIIYAINGAGNVEKFASNGTPLGSWNISGGMNLVVDSNNDIYVTIFNSYRVDKYSPTGTLLSSFSTPFRPMGIEIDNNGDIYLSDYYGNKVYKYSTGGTQLNSWGQYGTAPGEFIRPRGIAMDANNGVYIADWLNSRAQKVDGTLLVQNTGVNLTRLDAAKNVIKAIVSDSNLTGGADFGLMEWNTNATLLVPVSNTGAADIFNTVDSLTAGGWTHLDDAMNLAESYFLGPDSPMDQGAGCQENILIVISDGFWDDSTASATAESLYNTYGIKTFTVGFATTGNENYVTLSQKGGTYPDSPLYAENEEALLDVLSNYIQQIIASSLTFTAPTIIPNTANNESILQSTFTYKSNHQWKGRLLKYDLLPDGNIGSLLWDAGNKLNLKPSANRNIWTVATGLPGGINNFLVSELDRLRLPLEEYSGTAHTDQELTSLIDFIRGMDAYDEYPGDLDDEGEQLLPGERWKLADIYHSKASIVGPPSAYMSDETNPNSESFYRNLNNYKGFKESSQCGTICNNRDEIIYVGSNSGMLHAFASSTGDELWAFIPPSMLGSLNNIIFGQPNTSNSIFGVDGSPTVKDIFYSGQWHTVLLSGLRQGGNSYFALDVTDPYNPSHLFTFVSRPNDSVISYWDGNGIRTDYDTNLTIPSEYDFKELGEAWSQPVIIKTKISGADKWVAVIGGGFNNGINPNYGAQLYILDMEDGGKIQQNISLADTIPGNNIVSSVPPKVTAITADSTTLFQDAGALIYVTDLEGKLWVVNLSDKGVLYDKTSLFDAESTDVNDRYVFHELAATITTDQQLMMYFGTGDMQDLGSISGTIANRAYGLRDINFPTYSSVTPFTVTSLQDTTNPGAGCPSGSQKGWYKNMDTYEKVTAKATVANQTVFLSRYTPNSLDICTPGTAKLSEINFMCGDTVRDTDLGTGVPTEAVIYKNKIYIGVSNDAGGALPPGFTKNGNLIVGDPAVISEGEVRIESWKEDF